MKNTTTRRKKVKLNTSFVYSLLNTTHNHMTNNKLILKNTITLYMRMLLLMLVSLYTTRIVLENLGVMSYGIYNVVGGMMALFTFVQGSLNLSANRFMSYAIGQQDNQLTRYTFTATIQIHAILGLIIIILGETIGIWYFNNYLNIPSEYESQAFIVFQVSLIGCVISMMVIPLTASITAHEDMSIFAKFSVIDGLLKAGVALSLGLFETNRLVTYSILNLSVGLLTLCLWAIICNNKYADCKLIYSWNKRLIKEMFKFVGWQFFGSMSWMTRTQGVNLVLNYFFGPVLNASRNIAIQVNGGVTTLLNGFQVASNPQMVKNYASGQLKEMYQLVCRSSKLSYFLLLIIALPVYFSSESLLNIWLGNPPEYSVTFVKLIIIATLIENLSGTLPNAYVASGKLKKYQPITALIMISEIFLVYFTFKLGMPPEAMFYPQFIVFASLLIARICMLHPILGLNPMIYLKEVVLSQVITTCLSILVITICLYLTETIFDNLFTRLSLSFIITTSVVMTIGLTKSERNWAISILKSKFNLLSAGEKR